ncbi:glutathione synthase [Marinobacter hydrocarbonoclasticus]|nr:glutathione synthase [Marinobacter nauticus]
MTTPYSSNPLQAVVDDACEWALAHGMVLKSGPDSARHCAFSLAPIAIQASLFERLKAAVPLFARLIHGISEDSAFLQTVLDPMSKADPFFGHLLELHRRIHGSAEKPRHAPRRPLLMMRTDFMDDREQGPRVIEFNGIAAGMGPFGQRVHELHHYLNAHWPDAFTQWADAPEGALAENRAIEQMALAVAQVAKRVRDQSGEAGPARFLMVVQEQEDNVYDQRLLTEALQALGVRTLRRTFRELHGALGSGPDQRLMLEGEGGIDAVYLRAGYQYSDYCAMDLDEQRCCQALTDTRVFIERHNVAVNATVGQQLATSKTLQMWISQASDQQLQQWGLSADEVNEVKALMVPMLPISAERIAWFGQSADPAQWVLKNQGEGGGHCLFGPAILPRLQQMATEEYDAWALMWRLHPHERERPALAIRGAVAQPVANLVSELGLFTVHFDGEAMNENGGYCGYLIRSKPATANEGGVHSGEGMLDSLTLLD